MSETSSLNATPSANRVHIGFFGKRNAGKSSVVNAVTGQDLAVVSEIRGTTTDPVAKAMELLPMGPVMIIDTPGIDDEGTLGELRVRKAKQILNKTDVAVLVVDAVIGKTEADEELITVFRNKKIPFIIAYNKCDLVQLPVASGQRSAASVGRLTTDNRPLTTEINISAVTKQGIEDLKNRIASLAVSEEGKRRIVADLIQPGEVVVLVIPIDSAAPKGRLILPQQQTVRDVLDTGGIAVMVKETELRETLAMLGKKPGLVITDSQAFEQVAATVPPDIRLTSFSILFARYKGSLPSAIRGAETLNTLTDADTVLIAEGCTHHRQCDDIGTVKLPRWIRNYTGKEIRFAFTSGTEFPDDVTPYKLVIHCGGCMLNEREVQYRVKCAEDQGVPMTNYGIAIAFMQGILPRSIAAFPNS